MANPWKFIQKLIPVSDSCTRPFIYNNSGLVQTVYIYNITYSVIYWKTHPYLEWAGSWTGPDYWKTYPIINLRVPQNNQDFVSDWWITSSALFSTNDAPAYSRNVADYGPLVFSYAILQFSNRFRFVDIFLILFSKNSIW